jgi:hypothetical protein
MRDASDQDNAMRTTESANTGRERETTGPITQLVFHVAEPGVPGIARNLRSRLGHLRTFGMRYRKCEVTSVLRDEIGEQIEELWRACSSGYPGGARAEAWSATRGDPAARGELLYLLRSRQHLDAVMVARHDLNESTIVDYCGPADDRGLMTELAAHVIEDLTRRGTVRIRAATAHPQMIEALEYVGLVRSRPFDGARAAQVSAEVQRTGFAVGFRVASPPRAETIRVRRAGLDDRDAILAATRELLPGVDVTTRHTWLHHDNPHGAAITWIATDAATGDVAGITSFFPRRIVVNGRETLGALGGDGFVRPTFRRRGIASAMHGASRRDMAELGIEVMFGSPLPANKTPLSRHGTKDVVEIVRYSRWIATGLLRLPLAVDALLERTRNTGLRLDEFRPNDPRVDGVWEQMRPELGIATVRDAAFYDWRFRRSPSQKQRPFVVLDRGRPIAACALERVGNRLRVIDLVAPRDAWTRALTAIVGVAGDSSVVDIKLARPDAEARGLWRAGFFAREARVLNVMLPERSRDADSFFDGARWFFSWAETDQDQSL